MTGISHLDKTDRDEEFTCSQSIQTDPLLAATANNNEIHALIIFKHACLIPSSRSLLLHTRPYRPPPPLRLAEPHLLSGRVVELSW